MPKNDMLGKLDHHRVSEPLPSNKYDPVQEALQVVRDFKVDFRTMLNTINDDVARTRLENIFSTYIIKLETKIYAFQEENK